MVGSQSAGQFLLVGTAAKRGHTKTHAVGELDPEVSEAADALDPTRSPGRAGALRMALMSSAPRTAAVPLPRTPERRERPPAACASAIITSA